MFFFLDSLREKEKNLGFFSKIDEVSRVWKEVTHNSMKKPFLFFKKHTKIATEEKYDSGKKKETFSIFDN